MSDRKLSNDVTRCNGRITTGASAFGTANRAQVRLSADPQQFADEIAEWRYEVGMHIASANALIGKPN